MSVIAKLQLSHRASRWIVADIAVWALVAFAFALYGHVLAEWRGASQPWWPSLGYSLAIFSIWALLTPVLFVIVLEANGRLKRAPERLVAVTLGLFIFSALHVALFALLYWPFYNGAGAIPGRLNMAKRMAVRNLDTNALFYLLVIGSAAWLTRTRQFKEPSPPAPDAPLPATDDEVTLRVRSRGRLRIIRPAEIDWIGAAGSYAEIHAGGEVHLIDASLTALEQQLPSKDFARVHRSTLVRLERITELRSAGRGDGVVRLMNGVELRLSRRYRTNLAALIRPSDPARPPRESRSPVEPGPAT